jgi:predicted lipoprotein with Yx(FWY)xxD motif
MQKFLALAAAPLLLLAACASMHGAGNGTPAMMKDGVLVDAHGMTLYTFDRDARGSGRSSCNGDCAVKWPPLLAAAGDAQQGAFTIVVRDDGRRQWAYEGRPLYTWPEDQEPGDRYGDNYNKVWHVVR